MTRARVFLLGTLAVAAAAVVGVAGSGLESASARPSAETFGFALVVPCGFSHRNHDDPILYPGERGRSHDHTFFGNRSTNAFSTAASLRAQRRTTCGYPSDAAAYWVPTLFVGTRPVVPDLVVATYTRRTRQAVRAFPAGLKIVAGDAFARRPQSTDVVHWSCVRAAGRRSATIPTCSRARGGLQLNVRFPDCWDGERVDSPDHRGHMAYSTGGACPGSHPVEVPTLSLMLTYPVSGGPKAVLSSGRYGGHADFFNGWDQGTFAGLVDQYFNQ
jgi:hypothetical protein